jgi:plasmid stabilization system protein ParE
LNLYWTDGARADLRAIHRYISRYSDEHADSVIDRITQRSRQICQFPLSGTVLGVFKLGQIREIYEGKYRIIYYLSPADIQILGVLHSSLNLLRRE